MKKTLTSRYTNSSCITKSTAMTRTLSAANFKPNSTLTLPVPKDQVAGYPLETNLG